MRVEPRERALIAASALTCAAVLLLALIWPRAVLTGWLGGAVAFASIPTGALLLQLMMRLIPGAWGEELRLACEAGTLLAPLAAAAFVPVLLGAALIYPWATHEPISAFQGMWTGVIPFALRTILWFAFLILTSRAMRARWATGAVAAAGVLALPVLGSLAAIDWLMALAHEFASSGFGLQILSLQATIAFCALVVLRLSIGAPPKRLGVLGGLLLTLLLLWAYLQFLPFFIIWSGNLPPGVAWYAARATIGWDVVEWSFGLLGGVPLLLLLFARFRDDARPLRLLAGAALLGKLCEVAWFALPGTGIVGTLAYLLALAGLVPLAGVALLLALRHRVAVRAPQGTGT